MNVGILRFFEIFNFVYIVDNFVYDGIEDDLINFDYDVFN